MHLNITNVIKILEDKGIKVILEDSNNDTGYIDHSYELSEFLKDVSNDEEKLLQYLFSPLSFIITGNDNDCSDITINVSYEHDEYYKGN